MNEREALLDAIEAQDLYHGRHGTTPAGSATARAILSCLRNHHGLVLSSEPASTGLDVERLARAICGARPPELPPDYRDDMFVDDECRSLASRVAAEYARLSA